MEKFTICLLFLLFHMTSCSDLSNKDINEIKKQPMFDLGVTNKDGAFLTITPEYVAKKIAGKNGAIRWKSFNVANEYNFINKSVANEFSRWKGKRIGVEVEIESEAKYFELITMKYILVRMGEEDGSTYFGLDRVVDDDQELTFQEFFKKLNLMNIKYYDIADF